MFTQCYFLDVGASKTFRSLGRKSVCPLFDKLRCSPFGYLIPQPCRHLTLQEICTLQGMPKRILDTLVEATGGNDCAVAHAIGDAMLINVLIQLLPRALYSVGLLDALPSDACKASSGASQALHPDASFG